MREREKNHYPLWFYRWKKLEIQKTFLTSPKTHIKISYPSCSMSPLPYHVLTTYWLNVLLSIGTHQRTVKTWTGTLKFRRKEVPFCYKTPTNLPDGHTKTISGFFFGQWRRIMVIRQNAKISKYEFSGWCNSSASKSVGYVYHGTLTGSQGKKVLKATVLLNLLHGFREIDSYFCVHSVHYR